MWNCNKITATIQVVALLGDILFVFLKKNTLSVMYFYFKVIFLLLFSESDLTIVVESLCSKIDRTRRYLCYTSVFFMSVLITRYHLRLGPYHTFTMSVLAIYT